MTARPLHAVALGLVIIALYARAGSFDLLPDPLGWVLVLVGLRLLAGRVDVERVGLLWLLGALSLVAAGATWVPAVRDWFDRADPALGWAVDVPALAWCAVLTAGLGTLARRAGETGAATWCQWTAIGFAVAIAAPVIVIGGGVEGLRAPAELITGIAQLSLLALCVAYGGRSWAGAPEPAEPAETPT